MSSALPNVASEERTIRSIQSVTVLPGVPSPVVAVPTLSTLQVTVHQVARERQPRRPGHGDVGRRQVGDWA